jgi:hypothetical protein
LEVKRVDKGIMPLLQLFTLKGLLYKDIVADSIICYGT